MRPTQRDTLQLVGYALGLAAMAASIAMLWAILGEYDEGMVLTDAQRMLYGAVPYRDFYTSYPPGMPGLLAALWHLFGVHAVIARVVGLSIHLAIGGFVGRLAGRVAGVGFLAFPAAVALGFLVVLGLAPFAYLAAVALALGFTDAVCTLAARGPTPRRVFAVGLTLGCVSAFRHDVFVYLCCVYAVFAAVVLVRRVVPLDRAMATSAAWFGVGVVAPIVAVWGPVFARVDGRSVVEGLYFDQVHYVLPARVLPFPTLFPDFLVHGAAGSVILVLAAPLVAAIMALRSRDRAARLATLLVGALAVALLPQALGRSDFPHLIYALSPALILCGALIYKLLASPLSKRRASGAWLFAGWLVVLTATEAQAAVRATGGAHAIAPLWQALPMGDAAARLRVLDFIARNTRPGDPIYVGVTDHRRVTWNDMDLYFLADRPGAVREMQLDPNMVTRAEVQRVMVGELEATQAKVVILSSGCYQDEPNRSREIGATLLDAYLASHYDVAERAPPFVMMLRRARATPPTPRDAGDR